MGCHGSRNNRVEPTSKPQDAIQTFVRKEHINDTIEELKQFFGGVDGVHVMLGTNTITDYDIMPADMIVLDSYKNPFVYPPLSDNNQLNHLISDTPLPQGYVLYVVVQGAQKAYFYEVKNPSSPDTYVRAGPYLEPSSESGNMVPCKDTTNEPPDGFWWDQEGPDQVYKIHKEQNSTKLYWKYNGDGAIVTFVDTNALGLSVRLDFKQ